MSGEKTLTAKFKLIDEMSDKLSKMADSGEQMAQSFDKTEDMANAAFNSIEGKATSTAQKVDGVAKSATGAGKSAQDAGKKFKDMGDKGEDAGKKSADGMQMLQTAMTSLGIAKMVHDLADAFGEASQAAAEFETAINKVSTIADTSAVSIGQIQTDIQKLSGQTGKSVNELSESVYQAISASVDTADAVNFTATASQLAAGGFTSSTTAVDVLTTALNAYGLEASEANKISDMLITTQNLGKTSVDQLASSVGTVIPLAAAYNVQMENVSAAYAELTKGGISTAEAGTYLRAMLQELGDSGSDVSEILVNQTGKSFAQLMGDGASLGDVLDILRQSVNGDSTAFNELWGNVRSSIGALALSNAGVEQYNTTLAAMESSIGATAKAADTMGDSTEKSGIKFANAAKNIQITIGTAINPAIKSLQDFGTGIMNGINEFLQEHPVLTKAITAIAIGIGVTAAAIGGFVFVTQVAIPAITAFGVALNTALGPIGWVAMAIAGITAAVGAFALMMGDSENEVSKLTATSRQQYYELEDLNKQYDEACEKFGETSEEASRLKYQIDDLTAEYEANKQTLEEFVAEVEELTQRNYDLIDSYDSETTAIKQSELGTLALATKLSDLALANDGTVASQTKMEAIISQLNSEMPELNLSYESLMKNTNGVTRSVKEAAQAMAEQRRQEKQMESYVDLLEEQANLEMEREKALKNLEIAQEDYNKKQMEYAAIGAYYWEPQELKDYRQALEDIDAAMSANQMTVEEIERSWEKAGLTMEEAMNADMSYTEAAAFSYQQVQAQVEALAAAYDEAYQAAVESFAGQFSLFDEAQANMDATVQNAQAALDSQLEYWNSYNANLDVLKGTSAESLGIAEENYQALMAYAQSGTEEAAGFAASMAEAINSGNEEAVANLANTMAEVQKAQDQAAQTVADWSTGYSEELDKIEARMDECVENLDLDSEAESAAKRTIDGYIRGLNASSSSAVSAAASIASRVNSALGSVQTRSAAAASAAAGLVNGSTSSPSTFVAGEQGPELIARRAARYAGGTTDSENFFIAGENGPELIVGEPGATVFPTSETDRLISALNGGLSVSGGKNEKKITLEINGSGGIEVSGGSSKEDVLSILQENLRPVLMSIINQDIYEEGDLSYDY